MSGTGATHETARITGDAAVVAPRVDGLRNQETVLNEWKQTHADQPGYRWGKVVGPSGQIERVEVSSWLQVPEILAKLEIGRQSGNPCDVRLTFPRPSEGTDAEQAHAIVAAQKEISAFFKENHSKSAAEVRGALIEKLQKQKIPGGLTPEQWIDTNVTLNSIKGSSLSVTELIKIGRKGSGDSKQNDLQATLESALDQPTKHKIAFVVPGPDEAGFSQEAQQLAKTLGTTKTAGSNEIEKARQKALGRVSVWVEGAETAAAAGGDRSDTKPRVFSVEKFIEEVERGSSATAQAAAAQPAPPARPPEALADSSQPAAVGSASAQAVVPPAAVTPAPAVAIASAAPAVPATTAAPAPVFAPAAATSTAAATDAVAVPAAAPSPTVTDGGLSELTVSVSAALDSGDAHHGDRPGGRKQLLGPEAFAELKRLWGELNGRDVEVETIRLAEAAALDNQGLATVRYPEDGASNCFVTFTQKGKRFAQRVCRQQKPIGRGRLDPDAVALLDDLRSFQREWRLSHPEQLRPFNTKAAAAADKLKEAGLVTLEADTRVEGRVVVRLTDAGIQQLRSMPGRPRAERQTPSAPAIEAPAAPSEQAPAATTTPNDDKQKEAASPVPSSARTRSREVEVSRAALALATELIGHAQEEGNSWNTPFGLRDNQLEAAQELEGKHLLTLTSKEGKSWTATLTETAAERWGFISKPTKSPPANLRRKHAAAS